MVVKNPESGFKEFGEKTAEFKKSVEKAQKWSKKFKNADDMPDADIPKSWDFRNIGGYDYTGKLRDQGHCGSCFTMGFI